MIGFPRCAECQQSSVRVVGLQNWHQCQPFSDHRTSVGLSVSIQSEVLGLSSVAGGSTLGYEITGIPPFGGWTASLSGSAKTSRLKISTTCSRQGTFGGWRNCRLSWETAFILVKRTRQERLFLCRTVPVSPWIEWWGSFSRPRSARLKLPAPPAMATAIGRLSSSWTLIFENL